MFIYSIPIFISLFFIFIQEIKSKRSFKIEYFLLFLLLGVIGGIRFQTGDDWKGYQDFFEYIDVSQNFLEAYEHSLLYFRFEIGYFALNYFFKMIGFNLYVIFIISSLFCALSVYKFTSTINCNRFHIAIVYISFSFILLHFNEVRQSIAIGFFLLGFDYYLRKKQIILSVLISSIGLFFQVSEILYMFVAFIVIVFHSNSKFNIISIIFMASMLVFFKFFNFLNFLAGISIESIATKANLYANDELEAGDGQKYFIIYLIISYAFLVKYSKNLIEYKLKIISNYSSLSVLLTIVIILSFPNNYVMFNRVYVLSSIFLAIGCSIAIQNNKNKITQLMLLLNIVISITFYIRILLLNSKAYFPYQTIINLI